MVQRKQNLASMALAVNCTCSYMFYPAILPVYLVVIQNKENGEPEITDFGAIFDGIEFTQMANK